MLARFDAILAGAAPTADERRRLIELIAGLRRELADAADVQAQACEGDAGLSSQMP